MLDLLLCIQTFETWNALFIQNSFSERKKKYKKNNLNKIYIKWMCINEIYTIYENSFLVCTQEKLHESDPNVQPVKKYNSKFWTVANLTDLSLYRSSDRLLSVTDIFEFDIDKLSDLEFQIFQNVVEIMTGWMTGTENDQSGLRPVQMWTRRPV